MRAVLIIILILYSSFSFSGLVIYGTRFYLYEKNPGQIKIKNTGESSYLVKTSVRLTPDALRIDSTSNLSLIPSPPLFRINPEAESYIRIYCVYCDSLPGDRESMFSLNISAIPSSSQKLSSIQIGVRYHFSLIYRPKQIENNVDFYSKSLIASRINNKSIRFINNSPIYLAMLNSRTKLKINIPPWSSSNEINCLQGDECKIDWKVIDENGSTINII